MCQLPLSALGSQRSDACVADTTNNVIKDIDQFRAHMSTLEIAPIQLSCGRLSLEFASLGFEDVVISRKSRAVRLVGRLWRMTSRAGRGLNKPAKR